MRKFILVSLYKLIHFHFVDSILQKNKISDKFLLQLWNVHYVIEAIKMMKYRTMQRETILDSKRIR